MLLLSSTACGGESPTGGTRRIAVELQVSPAVAKPGDLVVVTISATPMGGAQVGAIELEASGLIDATSPLTLMPAAGGRVTAADSFYMPPAVGTLQLIARAQDASAGAGGSDTAHVTVADAVAPVVDEVAVPANTLGGGDSLTVRVSAHDDAALVWLVVRFFGAAARTDSIALGGTKVIDDMPIGIRVPVTATVGSALSLEVAVIDAGGNRTSWSAVAAQVVDVRAPSVTGTHFCRPTVDPLCVPGDTIRLNIQATDDHRLAWIGYEIGAPVSLRDSFAVDGVTSSRVVTLVAPRAWLGQSSITLFARDSAGHRAPLFLGTQLIFDGVRRPIVSPPQVTSQQYAWSGTAFDSLRQQVILAGALSGVPSFDFVSLEGALLRSLPVNGGGSIVGVDIGTGALADTAYFLAGSLDAGRVSLGAAPTVARRALDTVNVRGKSVDQGLVLSTGIYAARAWGDGIMGIALWNLATGEQRAFFDLRDGTAGANLARSPDGRYLLIWRSSGVSGTSPAFGWVYDAVTQVLGPATALPVLSERATATISADAQRILIGNTLFDRALSPIRSYVVNGTQPLVTAITPDGLTAYMYDDCCIVPRTLAKVRLADGAVLERIVLPPEAASLLGLQVVNGGRTLLARSLQRASFIIDVR